MKEEDQDGAGECRCGHYRHEHSAKSVCYHDYSISDWSIDLCDCNQFEAAQPRGELREPQPDPSNLGPHGQQGER